MSVEDRTDHSGVFEVAALLWCFSCRAGYYRCSVFIQNEFSSDFFRLFAGKACGYQLNVLCLCQCLKFCTSIRSIGDQRLILVLFDIFSGLVAIAVYIPIIAEIGCSSGVVLCTHIPAHCFNRFLVCPSKQFLDHHRTNYIVHRCRQSGCGIITVQNFKTIFINAGKT